jgi:hypothetical protein
LKLAAAVAAAAHERLWAWLCGKKARVDVRRKPEYCCKYVEPWAKKAGSENACNTSSLRLSFSGLATSRKAQIRRYLE